MIEPERQQNGRIGAQELEGRRQNADNRTASGWRLAQAARLMGIRGQGLVVSVRLLAVPSRLIAESLTGPTNLVSFATT